jgi:hypothetical protein
MTIRPFLENGGLVEWPIRGFCLGPTRVRAKQIDDGPIIRLVIRSEIEIGAGLGSFRHFGKKFGLNHTVLMVPPFRPGIREKNEDGAELRAGRHHGEEVLCVGTHEVQVCETGPLALPVGTDDAVRSDIYANAGLLWMRLCVGCEKVAVAAAHLPHKVSRGPNKFGN